MRESIFGNVNNINEQQIYSIKGILINRMYSNMRFAARSLLPTIIEEGLSDLFSLEFYGTREKVKELSEVNLITDMMESMAHKLDFASSINDEEYDQHFHPGRPDWNNIFLEGLSKAHVSNPEGESVGVFFCGSPAIAKDLQAIAAKVTAQHQYTVKCLEGTACKCKVIVHSENF